MLYSDELIESLKDDPVRGTIIICDIAIKSLSGSEFGWNDSDIAVLIEAYSLLAEILESKLLPIKINYLPVAGQSSAECQKIREMIHAVRDICAKEEAKLRMLALRNRFKNSLSSGFIYEFSQGDLEKIQVLISQLRDLIAATGHFEKEHQQRLLRRLEKLQSELHKKVSDLDRFWGLIGDAGVVLGKLGNDAKPIVDRIREIADIVWQTQSRAEELPSGTKLPQLENKQPTADEHS
jgi:hypothetical protein